MRKWWFIAAGICAGFSVQGQDVQWAARVQGFSSQAGQQAYAARQILGEPNKFPASGDSPVAWAPSFEDVSPERYIKVGFQKPMPVQQVMIAQTKKAGSIQAVYIYDRNQKEISIYQAGKHRGPMQDEAMLRIPVKETRFPVYSVKVVLKNDGDWDIPQIDAIGISASTDPWQPKIVTTTRFQVEGMATPLPGSVNSAYAEILPRLDPTGNRLYFCRKNHPENTGFKPNDDIWYAQRDEDGEWSGARNMGWPLNDENHNYICTVSEDGKMLTLGNAYSFDRKPLAGVSQSMLSGGQYGEPLNLRIDGLSILNLNAEYYLSRNRKVLILAMESWDSQGGKDLYVAFSEDFIHYSRPVSLGKNINTAGKEMAPFLSDDGMHLFFSSDGFPGYGSHDIYVAERLDETWTAWSKPENMGPGVNSAGWDSYFYFHQATGEAFLASNRDAFSHEDLYYLKITEKAPDKEPLQDINQVVATLDKLSGVNLSGQENPTPEWPGSPMENRETLPPAEIEQGLMLFGQVYDAVNKERISARIELQRSGEAEAETRFEGDSEYKYGVQKGQRYTATVSAPGYFSEKVQFTANDAGQGSMRQDFELIPLRVGQTISLENIYFDVNSAVLQEQSYESLDHWVELLREQPGVAIQVQGHTNNRCSPRYCLELSQKRAKAVSDYMQSHGIHEERLRFRGFGSELPVANNDEDEGRARNQRVELKILKIN